MNSGMLLSSSYPGTLLERKLRYLVVFLLFVVKLTNRWFERRTSMLAKSQCCDSSFCNYRYDTLILSLIQIIATYSIPVVTGYETRYWVPGTWYQVAIVVLVLNQSLLFGGV